jgi:hypothetical protein
MIFDGDVVSCLGVSENGVYLKKTLVDLGVHYFQTNPYDVGSQTNPYENCRCLLGDRIANSYSWG